jgi:aromatic ring-cleaving dioxygenase
MLSANRERNPQKFFRNKYYMENSHFLDDQFHNVVGLLQLHPQSHYLHHLQHGLQDGVHQDHDVQDIWVEKINLCKA